MTDAGPGRVTDRERTAMHEAGHVVAGYLLGRRHAWVVTIKATDDYLGRATYLRRTGGPVVIPNPKPPGFPVVGMDARSRRTAEVALLVILAGGAATDVYCPPTVGRGEGYVENISDWGEYPNDASRAFEIAHQLGPGSETELIAYMRSRAGRLLRDPVAVALLGALTEALLERETLTGTEVRRLLREMEHKSTTKRRRSDD